TAKALSEELDTIKRPPGRQEKVQVKDRTVIFDVAHTPRSIQSLLKTVTEIQDKSNRYLLYGSLEGKEIDDILDKLNDCFDPSNVIFTRPESSR
ncbi:MAG: glutamate ligase domain-containing protein, partial [bacterium]